MSNFTDLEDEILTDIVELFNKYDSLPNQHPDDSRDIRDAIHTLQEKVMIRPVRRNNERFINTNE